jgi:hypothetical protein
MVNPAADGRSCAWCGGPTRPHRRFCSSGCGGSATPQHTGDRSAIAFRTFAHRKGPNKTAYLEHLAAEVAAGRYLIDLGLIVDGILTWYGPSGNLTDADCALLLERL